MPDSHTRAARFETHRPHLLAVAIRLLASATEAEDAVQEAWLGLDRAGEDGIENLGGWLTTVGCRGGISHGPQRGDFQALLAVLDPGVALRADDVALRMGARNGWLLTDANGAEAVANQFAGRAQAAQMAQIDGAAGAVWAPGGRPRVVLRFTIEGDTIVAINLIANPQVISALDIVIVDEQRKVQKVETPGDAS